MKNLELQDPTIKEWVKQYCRGVDFGATVYVKSCRIIDGKRCYLLTRGGHTGWYAIGTTKYYQSMWWIAFADDPRGWSRENHYCEREGRQNAETIEEMWGEMRQIIEKRKGGEK